MRTSSPLLVGAALVGLAGASAPASAQQSQAQANGLNGLQLPVMERLGMSLPTGTSISDTQAQLSAQAAVSTSTNRAIRPPSVNPVSNGEAGLQFVATVAGHQATVHASYARAGGDIGAMAMKALSSYMPPSGEQLLDNTPAPGQVLISEGIRAAGEMGKAAVTAAMVADGSQSRGGGARHSMPSRGQPAVPAPMPQVNPSYGSRPQMAVANEAEESQNYGIAAATFPSRQQTETGSASGIQLAAFPVAGVIAGAAGAYLADKTWSELARKYPVLGEADCKVGAGIGYGLDVLTCPPMPVDPYGNFIYDPDLMRLNQECNKEAVDALRQRWNDCTQQYKEQRAPNSKNETQRQRS